MVKTNDQKFLFINGIFLKWSWFKCCFALSLLKYEYS